LLDPKIVVLSGDAIDKGGDNLILKIRKVTFENIINADKRDIRIEKSIAGRYARIKGISSLIYDINFREI